MCDVKEQKSKPERNGYGKKSRKRVVIPVILFLAVYPEIYQEELRIIFGEDCEIGEKNTIFVEGEDCDCGSSSSSYQYDTWEVTYHDRRGERGS